jgi:hypothetical protein
MKPAHRSRCRCKLISSLVQVQSIRLATLIPSPSMNTTDPSVAVAGMYTPHRSASHKRPTAEALTRGAAIAASPPISLSRGEGRGAEKEKEAYSIRIQAPGTAHMWVRVIYT